MNGEKRPMTDAEVDELCAMLRREWSRMAHREKMKSTDDYDRWMADRMTRQKTKSWRQRRK